jgi:hypothetical protein
MLIAIMAVYLSQAVQAAPCAGLPPGKHSLLERFTEQFTLTCEQQLKIEPLLHAEESVSKPLLAFAAFTPEEQQGVMLKVKVAARRQIRGLLTPDQQKLMDSEIESVTKAASKGGKKGAPKKAPPKVDPYENEEGLSQAVMNYAALSPDEKKAIVMQIKQAAVKDDSLGLTPEQRKKIEADLRK